MTERNFYNAGAALAGVTQLDVPAMEVVYQLEISGEVFYEKVAAIVGNEKAAELLLRNGREERAHARRIAKAISIKLGHEWQPSAEVEEILPIPMPPTLDVEAFKGMIKGEVNGDAGYQFWADNEPDEEIAKLLRLNGREESIHAERLNEVIALLS
jgi:rubrerythrin